MTGPEPLRRIGLVLPLLSFGAGATDAFAFTALGGIFTANMTGNAVLAAMFSRPGYLHVLAGASASLVAFAFTVFVGFRITRGLAAAGENRSATLTALGGAVACHLVVVALWWCTQHSRTDALLLILASSAAMALQTVAAKRDGVSRGSTTTYLTGTMTDLLQDVAEGRVLWVSERWVPIVALPVGAACAIVMAQACPIMTPVLPLVTTFLCIAIIAGPVSECLRRVRVVLAWWRS